MLARVGSLASRLAGTAGLPWLPIPLLASVAADFSAWLATAVEGAAVPFMPALLPAAGSSWVVRADAGGTLVLTGRSAVVLPSPATALIVCVCT